MTGQAALAMVLNFDELPYLKLEAGSLPRDSPGRWSDTEARRLRWGDHIEREYKALRERKNQVIRLGGSYAALWGRFYGTFSTPL